MDVTEPCRARWQDWSGIVPLASVERKKMCLDALKIEGRIEAHRLPYAAGLFSTGRSWRGAESG